MFKERLVSGAILLAITIFVVFTGGNILFGTVATISLIGLRELYQVLGFHNTLLGFAGYIGSLCIDGVILIGREDLLLHLLIGLMMILLTIYVLSYPKYKAEQITMAYFGLYYVSIMLSYIYRIRMMDDGLLLVWLIFIGAWGSDTCAYCVGKLFGKHKFTGQLAALSPKKSIEGCIGGVVGAALIGAIYGYFAKDALVQISEPVFVFAVIGGISSVIAQIGDLAASAIKRNHNIKDYGTLIPGHGGILDRFDSIIFTAPIVYILAVLL